MDVLLKFLGFAFLLIILLGILAYFFPRVRKYFSVNVDLNKKKDIGPRNMSVQNKETTISGYACVTDYYRLGNFVAVKERLTSIVELHESHFKCSLYDNLFHIGYATRIDLTEEWLFRLGFTKQINDFYIGFGSNRYYVSSSSGKWWISRQDIHPFTIVNPIEYVDQLQNMFYFVTGQELTLKNQES